MNAVNVWKVILATLVIFGTGVVTGGLLVKSAMHLNDLPPASQQSAPVASTGTNASNGGNGGAQAGGNPWLVQSRNLLRRMDRELALTGGQRDHMEQLITNSQERTKIIWKPITPQMSREMGRLHREMRDQLTPEQATKFDGFFKQRPSSGKRRPGTNSPVIDTNSLATNVVPTVQ